MTGPGRRRGDEVGESAGASSARRRRFAASLLVAGLAVACSPPPIEAPDAGIAAPRRWVADSGRVRASDIADAWWRGFGSPTLDRLVDEALAANHDVAAAAARLDQATARRRMARADLLPTGEATAARLVSREPAAAAGSPTVLPITRLWDLGFATAYEVDVWGRRAAATASAESAERAGEYDLAVARLTVAAAVVDAWLEAAALTDRLRVARANLALARRIRDVLARRVEAGSSTAIELTRQDYVVARQEASLPALSRAASRQVLALAPLLGTTPEAVVGSLAPESLGRMRLPEIGPGVPASLMLRRPDLAAAEARLAAGSADVAAARAALFPRLGLSATLGLRAPTTATLFSPQALTWSASGSLTQEVFGLPSRIEEVSVQEARRRELLADYRGAIVAAFTDVDRALVEIRRDAEEERALRRALAAARRGHDLSVEQLEAGSIDLITLLDVQRGLSETEDALVQVRLARFRAARLKPSDLVVKLFGGANTMQALHPADLREMLDVGRKNVDSARAALAAHGLSPSAEDVLGPYGRKL
ncbi:MAG: efflux transporter outer membrane subunit, partial [Siculibacillus sp.]|nr:efflux transporter outer membrane subunit [Siculibacillus sp.]